MKKLNNVEVMYNLLQNNKLEKLQEMLENECFKKYSFNTDIKKYFKNMASHHYLNGYFIINEKIVVCNNFTAYIITENNHILWLLKNKKQLNNENNNNENIKRIEDFFLLKKIFNEDLRNNNEISINLFDIKINSNFNDSYLVNVQDIKLNYEYIKLACIIGKNKNLRLSVNDNLNKPCYIINDIGDIKGFILPIFQKI
jgi:hypothetical protein